MYGLKKVCKSFLVCGNIFLLVPDLPWLEIELKFKYEAGGISEKERNTQIIMGIVTRKDTMSLINVF